MNLRIGQLSDRFYVSGQIAADHVAVLAEHGFKTIVNNRPDGEQWGQPTSDEIAAAAAEHGIDYVFLPVRSNGVVPADVEAFIAAREKMKGPCCCSAAPGLAARCSGSSRSSPASWPVLRNAAALSGFSTVSPGVGKVLRPRFP